MGSSEDGVEVGTGAASSDELKEQVGTEDAKADSSSGDMRDGVQPWEADQPRMVTSPRTPTQRERDEHDLTHCPPRSWCDHCVRGQAKDDPHRLVCEPCYKDSSVTRISMDYAFLKEDTTVKETEHDESVLARMSMTILVMTETLCGSIWGYAVESKGATEMWIADQVAEDLQTVGITQERVIVKADQEPSITEIQNDLCRIRAEFGTAIEQSGVGDSNSNGKVERTIQDYKGLTRTMRSVLEFRLGIKITLDNPIVPWMIRHVGHILTFCRVRDHGRTAYNVTKGRKITCKLVPFGERVLFKIPKTNKLPGDFQDRWESGIWLGFMMRSGEHLVSADDGVHKVCTVRRVDPSTRWSVELVNGIKALRRSPFREGRLGE